LFWKRIGNIWTAVETLDSNMPPTDHSKIPDMNKNPSSKSVDEKAAGQIPRTKARHDQIRQPKQFHDLHLKIEKLNNVKPKGLRGLIQSTRLGSKSQSAYGKEKLISTLTVSEAITTFRKRSSKPEKEYQSLHLKHMINLDFSKCKERGSVVEIYSNRGEVWFFYADEEIGKKIYDELKAQFKLIKDSQRYKKDMEYFNLAFLGQIEYVQDRNQIKKDFPLKITTGRKIILLSTTPHGTYQLELRGYSADNAGGFNQENGPETRIIIEKDHAYSWSFTDNQIHFCLKEKAPVGRIDFLIYCYDAKKLSERIKPFIEKEKVIKKPLLTEEQQIINRRKQRAIINRQHNGNELNNKPPITRSRSNYCNSVEQRSHSWKSSKSPQSSSISPNDSGVTAGTPGSTEYAVK